MSVYLKKDWQKIKDELMVKFLTEEQFQPSGQDLEVYRRAEELIRVVYQYKRCHLACCTLHESGIFKEGIHVYCRRMHEFSVCAEHLPIQYSHRKFMEGSPDPIVTLATFHGGHDIAGNRTKSYVESPCPKCLRLLKQVAPNSLIMVDLDGQGRLAKIPLEAVEFFCHSDKHNGEG